MIGNSDKGAQPAKTFIVTAQLMVMPLSPRDIWEAYDSIARASSVPFPVKATKDSKTLWSSTLAQDPKAHGNKALVTTQKL